MKAISHTFGKAQLLIFGILVWGLLQRLVPIWGNQFTFMYDHAKDSLVIMEMGTRFKPALFGAVTSIPGVYNGPLWYYVALPLNLVMQYHPLSGVVTIIGFALLSIYATYKWFGWPVALVYAGAVGIVGSQQSAWSPYMTVFPMLPIIYLLLQLKPGKALSTWQLWSLPVLVSSLFHFQTAFGVVVAPLVVACFLILKVKISFKEWLLMAVLGALLFAPLMVFELRHDFHQTKQVMAFIQKYGQEAHVIQPNKPGLARIPEIAWYLVQSAGQAVTPLRGSVAFVGVAVIGSLILLLAKSNKISRTEKVVLGVFGVGPLLLYQFLPCKSYYLVGLYPVWLAVVSVGLRHLTPAVIKGLAVGWLVLNTFNLYVHYHRSRLEAQQESFFYAPQAAAIEKVYELSQGQSFSSYHFVPEIYDYTYQHIYLTKIRQGMPAPTEFSYAPGEVTYIQQKMKLQEAGLISGASQGQRMFLIVEDYVYPDVFESWWQRVVGDKSVKAEYHINDVITVYEINQPT